MEGKSSFNSRPIIGTLIVGEHKTKDKELVALVHFTKFHFPSSQDSVHSISSAGHMPEQGYRC